MSIMAAGHLLGKYFLKIGGTRSTLRNYYTFEHHPQREYV